MESSLQACCLFMWKNKASPQWLEAFETTASSFEEETCNAGNDMVLTDGWLELVVKHSDAKTKITQKAHTKHIQSPINFRTDSSFNHQYMHGTVPNDKPCSSLICHRCCYVFGKRFPVMLMINRSAGDIWSDDKAGASVAPHPLYFNFPRDDKDRPLQLHTAQRLSFDLCCKL